MANDHRAVRCRRLVRPGSGGRGGQIVTLPYGALVGVLLYLDLRARKEPLDLDALKANLQASTA